MFVVAIWNAKVKAFQPRKAMIARLDEFPEDGTTPSKGDLAHSIAAFKYGMHAPNGAASDVARCKRL
jgi:hypothetical protein